MTRLRVSLCKNYEFKCRYLSRHNPLLPSCQFYYSSKFMSPLQLHYNNQEYTREHFIVLELYTYATAFSIQRRKVNVTFNVSSYNELKQQSWLFFPVHSFVSLGRSYTQIQLPKLQMIYIMIFCCILCDKFDYEESYQFCQPIRAMKNSGK